MKELTRKANRGCVANSKSITLLLLIIMVIRGPCLLHLLVHSVLGNRSAPCLGLKRAVTAVLHTKELWGLLVQPANDGNNEPSTPAGLSNLSYPQQDMIHSSLQVQPSDVLCLGTRESSYTCL